MHGSLYEYQWKLDPRSTGSDGRDSRHLPSPNALAPLVEQEGEHLRQRFNRARYQDEFQSLSRAAVAAYIVKALRELGWTPQRCAAHGDRQARRSTGRGAAISPVAPANAEAS